MTTSTAEQAADNITASLAAAPKRKPSEVRMDAMNVMVSAVREYNADAKRTVWHEEFDARADVAASIRALARHGRTARWTEAIEAWAVMVEDAADAEHYRWAFDQYGIWAAYAAE